MNGAEALIETLVNSGVEVCFANPGTSEMQLVAAIDRTDGMRAVLGLFEGVVTGAADGYARMTDKPALTLMHLGPGLANGLANLHNARRAGVPMINLVGDHATYHLQYDAPLTSDAEGVARPMSDWVRISKSQRDLAQAGAEALAASQQYPGQITTVIVPANHAWDEGAFPVAARPVPAAPRTAAGAVTAAATALKAGGRRACLFLGGRALREDALIEAGRIAAATGARLVAETFFSRMQRGVGRVAVERLPYFGEEAQEFLADFDHIILCGTEPPVSFFAYPGKPSFLAREDAQFCRLASRTEDLHAALSDLAAELQAPGKPALVQQPHLIPTGDGPISHKSIGTILAELMPEDAIISDEGATAGGLTFPLTAGAAPHDWLYLTGGAIGQGLPAALGAAIACPGRKVISLQADGSAMYTNQALWTMARENLDVTVLLLNNGSYAVLNVELMRVGASNPGPKALSMLDLRNPDISWTKLAEGMGVPAVRTTTNAELHTALSEALAQTGPRLVEVMV